jgi:hypothetical protein
MNQLNNLINEYNYFFELSKKVGANDVMSIPNHTFSNSATATPSHVNSVEECINSLKNNELYIGGTYYKSSDNNCFLYDKSTNPSLVNGDGIAILRTTQYYNEKMAEIFDQVKDFLLSTEGFTSLKYSQNVDKLNNAESIYNFINNKHNLSSITLQNSNVMKMKWIFIFLVILSIIFQMFENMILKSISIVSFVGAIVVLLNILKLLNSFIFSIALLSLFSAIVLVLFFKKLYIPSFAFLLFGAIGCNFYINYKVL